MRKIRIFEHISLDGIIAPSGRGDDYANGGWTAPYRTPGGAAAVAEAQGSRFDLLLGRRTYDLWSGFWPKAPSSPIADSLNAATKYVATHRPESLEWGPVESLGTDVMDGIGAVKAQDGPGLIVWGSTTLTTLLLAQGLADELVLLVYPILLGQGKRFFEGTAAPCALALARTNILPSGIVMLTYRLSKSDDAA